MDERKKIVAEIDKLKAKLKSTLPKVGDTILVSCKVVEVEPEDEQCVKVEIEDESTWWVTAKEIQSITTTKTKTKRKKQASR